MIDPTAGTTLLVAVNPDPLVRCLADKGIIPDHAVDPDTFTGRLAVIMTGRSDALIAYQGQVTTMLPLPGPEKACTAADGRHLDQPGPDTPLMQNSTDVPDTLEMPEQHGRADLLDLLADRADDYIKHSHGRPTARRGRSQAKTQERNTQPCPISNKQ